MQKYKIKMADPQDGGRPRRFSRGTTRRLSAVGIAMLREVEREEQAAAARSKPLPRGSVLFPAKKLVEPTEDPQEASAAPQVDYFSQALKDRVRKQLHDFYSQRDQSKLAQVDNIMASYAGKEHEVVKLLEDAMAREQQADPQQAKQEQAKRILIEFYRERDPQKINSIQGILDQYLGREEEIPHILARSQQAERERAHALLIKFYSERDPSKLGQIERIMQEFSGMEWKIPRMLEGQQQQAAQPPPHPQATATATASAAVSASAGPAPTSQEPVRRFSKGTMRRLSSVGTELLRQHEDDAAVPPEPALAKPQTATASGRRKVSSFGGLFQPRERSFSYKSPLGAAGRKTLRPATTAEEATQIWGMQEQGGGGSESSSDGMRTPPEPTAAEGGAGSGSTMTYRVLQLQGLPVHAGMGETSAVLRRLKVGEEFGVLAREFGANGLIRLQLEDGGWVSENSCSDPSVALAEEVTELFHLNVTTYLLLTRLYVNEMIKSPAGGRVLQTASVASFVPAPWAATYHASKAYVRAFSEAMQYELRDTDVSVTTLCPGVTETGFFDAAEVGDKKMLIKDAFKWFFVHQSRPVAMMGVEACLRGATTVIPGVWNNLSMFWVVRFFSRPMANVYLFNQWIED